MILSASNPLKNRELPTLLPYIMNIKTMWPLGTADGETAKYSIENTSKELLCDSSIIITISFLRACPPYRAQLSSPYSKIWPRASGSSWCL